MQVVDLGLTYYPDATLIQDVFIKKVSQGLFQDTLLITEHKPVITIGRRGSSTNILKPKEFLDTYGIEICKADRGGDVTYHGPGQIIAYPIFKLENKGRDIHRFLDTLEKIGLLFMEKYGLDAYLKPGYRGVWFEGKKVISIGIGIRKWVTYHGMAINVNLDVLPFSFIRPCGLEGVEMASLKSILNKDVDIEDAKNRLVSSFKEVSLLVDSVSKN